MPPTRRRRSSAVSYNETFESDYISMDSGMDFDLHSLDREQTSSTEGMRKNAALVNENGEDSQRKKRTRHACNACRLKKAGCSGTQPCRNCVDGQLNCSYTINDNSQSSRTYTHSEFSTERQMREQAEWALRELWQRVKDRRIFPDTPEKFSYVTNWLKHKPVTEEFKPSVTPVARQTKRQTRQRLRKANVETGLVKEGDSAISTGPIKSESPSELPIATQWSEDAALDYAKSPPHLIAESLDAPPYPEMTVNSSFGMSGKPDFPESIPSGLYVPEGSYRVPDGPNFPHNEALYNSSHYKGSLPDTAFEADAQEYTPFPGENYNYAVFHNSQPFYSNESENNVDYAFNPSYPGPHNYPN